jgi:tripartite-type tricarboxylate transporter receptor subunit TctC
MHADLRIDAQPLGCHAQLQAGHPVITPRQVEAKAPQARRSEVTGSSASADDDDAVHGNGLALAPMRIGMVFFRALALALTFAGSALPNSSWAQTFPTQRVTIVVPFGAGSVTDIMARILADETSRQWGQQVIVENRPGLAGTGAVAKAAADGYTLMLTSNGHTVAALVNKNLPFDPVKDFAGITRVSSAPLCLIVNPQAQAKSVKELLTLAKAQPGTLNFSSAGLASTTFIAGALFRRAAGIDIVHVPFKSAPDAVTAVVRGDAQMYFVPINLSKEMAEAGKVRALAVATPQRLAELPDVPTFREAGLDFVYDSWFGLMTGSGVPRDIVHKTTAMSWRSCRVRRSRPGSLRNSSCRVRIPRRSSTASFAMKLRSSPRCSRISRSEFVQQAPQYLPSKRVGLSHMGWRPSQACPAQPGSREPGPSNPRPA